MNNITDDQTHFPVIKTLLLVFSLFVVYGTLIPFNFIVDRQEIIDKISAIGKPWGSHLKY